MQFEDKGVMGPDVSFYQADPRKNQYINFQKMKDYGVSFVIMKAGQFTYPDPAFIVNWSESKRVGIPRAAYWFLDKDDSGENQAIRFWNLLKDDPGEGPLIVDFEDGSGDWRRLYNFIVKLQALSKYPSERIWIYTGYFYWLSFGPKDRAQATWFAAFPLWLAAYDNSSDGVKVPFPWLRVVMWQKGTTIVYGPDMGVLSLEIDLDIFNGDRSLFNRYFITDYIPAPPENNTGGNSMKYKVIWSGGAARRTAPHTGTATEITYTGLSYSQWAEVEVIEDNIPDKIDPNNANKRWVKFATKMADGRDLFGASNYPNSAGVPSVRMEKIVEPTPVPTTPTKVHQIDIFSDGKVSIDGGPSQ